MGLLVVVHNVRHLLEYIRSHYISYTLPLTSPFMSALFLYLYQTLMMSLASSNNPSKISLSSD